MAADSSSTRTSASGSSKDVQLDELDRRLLSLLAADARTPNNALAAELGIAPSTCLGRMRALREAGVIRGYHADIDQVMLGQGLQALIAVRLQSGARDQINAFLERIKLRPEVQSVFFLAGADDFLMHVSATDAHRLRDFVVEELSTDHAVALTETNLIFEHIRGTHATTH